MEIAETLQGRGWIMRGSEARRLPPVYAKNTAAQESAKDQT
jgi:hypothetical protein